MIMVFSLLTWLAKTSVDKPTKWQADSRACVSGIDIIEKCYLTGSPVVAEHTPCGYVCIRSVP